MTKQQAAEGVRPRVRAVVVDPAAPEGMRLGAVPEPVADPGQVVVDVHHVSLNRGDLNDATSGRLEPGAVLGSDAAGIVVRAASDGRGPAPGTRVVALARGAFAERIAVDVDDVADVPAAVELDAAAALPVAGLAAIQALRAGGLASGKRVLVTGASGGVGRFAVAIAASAGAHVIASVGSAARGAGLARIGAAEVVVGLDDVREPVDLIVDNVGGPQLVGAWQRLAAGGDLQSVGWTSGEPAAFPPYSTIGPPRTLSSFLIQGPVGADLSELVELVAAGRLRPEIGWRGSLERVREAAGEIRARRVDGKAILDAR
ncbi:MAG TPA: zinc-binding dehydrogenase [Solirubrobacteraceae bacterium]|nr:zinc-binding dehydrogenase [Solirubrobacteraceae bacterium]